MIASIEIDFKIMKFPTLPPLFAALAVTAGFSISPAQAQVFYNYAAPSSGTGNYGTTIPTISGQHGVLDLTGNPDWNQPVGSVNDGSSYVSNLALRDSLGAFNGPTLTVTGTAPATTYNDQFNSSTTDGFDQPFSVSSLYSDPGNTFTFSLSGLAGGTYDLAVYGVGIDSSRYDSVTLNGISTQAATTSAEGSYVKWTPTNTVANYFEFDNVVVSNGVMSFSVTNGPNASQIDVQGFQLEEEVPEPGTWALMLLGFGGLALGLRRRAARNS